MTSQICEQKYFQITPKKKIKNYFFSYENYPSKRNKKLEEKMKYYNTNNKIINQKMSKNNKRPKSLIYSSNTEKNLNLDYPIISKKEQDAVFNNLYNDNFYRKEKLRKLSQEKEEKFNSIYTFFPDTFPNSYNEKYLRKQSKSYSKIELNKYNEKIHSNSFINRLYDYQRKKKENLNKIKNEIFASSPHPKIKKKYLKNFKLPLNSQKFLSIKNEKINRLSKDILNEQGVTFRPKLNDTINSLIRKKFYQRNLDYQKQKEIKLNNIKEDIECTFNPKINNDNSIIQNNINNLKYNVGERLYNYQSKYKENLDKIKIKNEKYYSFKPKISKNTNSILENKKRINSHLLNRKQLFEEYSKKINNEIENNIHYNINENKKENKENKENKDIKENKENIRKKKKHLKSNSNIIDNNNEYKKYYINDNNKLNIYNYPISVNIFNENRNNIKDLKNYSKQFNFENPFEKNKKRNKGRNVISTSSIKHFSNGFSNEEKERPTTNCSTANSKSIVNLNYYDNLI